TQFSNSSHSKDTPTGLAQVHVHKQRSAEEPGSGGLSETSSSTSPSTTTTNLNADSLDFKDEDEDEDFEDSDPRWHSEILQPDGSLVDLERRHQPITNTPPAQFTNQPDNHIIQVSFNQPDRHQQIETPPTPQLQELQGGDPTSWTLSDFYDYLSPDYSTTRGIPGGRPAASSNLRPFAIDDGASGGYDPAGPAGAVEAEDSSGCLLGFVRRNGTCQSPCELFTNYCYNGGQCFVMDGIGTFCRCNMQSYIWNKGTRCESVITEFQVMCIVVGGTSLVVLVLFMVIVFFSKRLHLLKIENRRLRKRSKFRPQSEQQNDNFSLSTIAEGSQANVRKLCDSPNPPHVRALAYYDNIICQKTMSKYVWEYRLSEEPCGEEDTAKQEEPSKSPTKEDESLNIQNSLTPKLENNKSGGEENAEEVNSLQNNMM
uniref:Chondroitin sulfate proteoglycan 5b n=1 Tax=Astyanax mexicanus TaxID=7994 RepID=A0A3B1JA59_ASTMX